ncbi:MAG: hypothetical protein AAGF87_01230 [Bacteroidota bacterium]
MLRAKLKEVPANYHDRLNKANVVSTITNILLLLAVTVFSDSSQVVFYGVIIFGQAAATVLLFKAFKSRMSRVLLVDTNQIVLEDSKGEDTRTFDIDQLEDLKRSNELHPVGKRKKPWWRFPFTTIEVPWISFLKDGEQHKYHYDPESEYMRNRLAQIMQGWEQ